MSKFEINQKLAKEAIEHLDNNSVWTMLYNLLLLYTENHDRGDNLQENIEIEKKINEIVSSREELISILKNPKSIDWSIVKANNIKDFYNCIDYLIKEKGYKSKEKMILEEFNFSSFRKFTNHLHDRDIAPSRLWEVAYWIETNQHKIDVVYYFDVSEWTKIHMRVSKEKKKWTLQEYKDRTFASETWIINDLIELSWRDIFQMLDLDRDKVLWSKQN